MSNASLVVVGSGIKFLSHLTTEAKAYIQQSDIVLYLVNEPVMQEWIQNNSIQSESLEHLYTLHPLRANCYKAITNYILEILQKNLHICVVIYGHPTIFAQPALDAAITAKQQGYYTKILPGISAEDCLFADLLIDPGSVGCLSFEATDFLVREKRPDPTSHLILWQVGRIGLLHHSKFYDNKKAANLLLDYLKNYYMTDHAIVLYEAAQYPGFEPKILQLPLADLPHAEFSAITTMHVPPAAKASINYETLSLLGINLDDLQNSISVHAKKS